VSVIFSTTYWLLGDGADDEAKKWIAEEPHKKILWSSDKAVLLCEEAFAFPSQAAARLCYRAGLLQRNG
jgi:hypothetical protein